MQYTTVQFSNLKARYILDIYQLSLSLWKCKTFRWAWHLRFISMRWWQIGPLECMVHPVTRVVEQRDEAAKQDGAGESPKTLRTED